MKWNFSKSTFLVDTSFLMTLFVATSLTGEEIEQI